jgi:hypothetical protein
MQYVDAHNRAYRTMPAVSPAKCTHDGAGDGGLPAPSRQGRECLPGRAVR